MARSEARIAVSIWDDGDFLALSLGAQRMFMFLLSQKDLAHTGVIALRERRWSRTAKGLNVKLVVDALDELVAGRFIVMDEEAEEVLIRSFIRRDKVYRQPNVLRAAADQLETVSSPAVLAVLAEELRRVAIAEDIPESAAAIVADMLAIIGNPTPNPSPEGSGKGSHEPFTEPHGDAPEVLAAEAPATVDSDAGHSVGAIGHIGPAPVQEGSENPSANPTRSTPGERGDVTYLEVSPRAPEPRAPDPDPQKPAPLRGGVLRLVEDQPPTTTEALIGEWIEHCRRRPPGNVIGRVGRAIKTMLAEDVDPADIRAGLALWWRKGADPSALPSFVNQAMNAQPAARPRPNGDIDWAAAMQRAEAREAR